MVYTRGASFCTAPPLPRSRCYIIVRSLLLGMTHMRDLLYFFLSNVFALFFFFLTHLAQSEHFATLINTRKKKALCREAPNTKKKSFIKFTKNHFIKDCRIGFNVMFSLMPGGERVRALSSMSNKSNAHKK
jgi:hypothetical protein